MVELFRATLLKLSVNYCGEQVQNLMELTLWRKASQVPAGRMRLGLQMILGNVRIRTWWNQKCLIFRPLVDANPPPSDEDEMKNLYGFMSENNLTENH